MQRHRPDAAGAGLGDVLRLVDLRRGRQAVGRGRRGRQLGRWQRLAITARSGVGRTVHREIEMEMIVVVDVGARPEHGREMLAGAGMDLVQERRLLAAGLLPILDDADAAPVRKFEAGDVDRIAEGVFGKLRARNIVDAPAAIGAEGVQPDDGLAEARLGARLDDFREPRSPMPESSNNRL